MLRAALALFAIGWLWFLARGRSRGGVKRLQLRVTLLAIATGLVWAGASRGLFVRSTAGFRIAVLLAVLVVAVGYLYTTRFCGDCGRMVRNLRAASCPRCGTPLPRHGMTAQPGRSADDEPAPKPRRRSPLR